MTMTLSEEDLKAQRPDELVGEVWWCCPVQTFEPQNNDCSDQKIHAGVTPDYKLKYKFSSVRTFILCRSNSLDSHKCAVKSRP